MKPLDEAEIRNAISIILDVAVNILYLAGIAAIELLLRPLFGAKGVSRLAGSILTTVDLALFFALARRLVIASDNLVRMVRDTVAFDPLAELRRRTDEFIGSLSSPTVTESPTAEESEEAPHTEASDEVSATEEPGESPAMEAEDGEQSDRAV